jgi:hypothetical protein
VTGPVTALQKLRRRGIRASLLFKGSKYNSRHMCGYTVKDRYDLGMSKINFIMKLKDAENIII